MAKKNNKITIEKKNERIILWLFFLFGVFFGWCFSGSFVVVICDYVIFASPSFFFFLVSLFVVGRIEEVLLDYFESWAMDLLVELIICDLCIHAVESLRDFLSLVLI